MGSRRFLIPEKFQGRITKFFVTNLPDNCSGKDLAEYTRHLGGIYDLYIAKKRDRVGNRFGFISFLDVKEVEDMVRLLCGIKMGDYRLKANVARFSFEEGEIGQPPRKNGRTDGIPSEKERIVEDNKTGDRSFTQEGWSYQEKLTGIRHVKREEKAIMVDEGLEVYKEYHGKAVIMRMIDLNALKHIYMLLNDFEAGPCRVQYIGGLSVMVTFGDEAEALRVIAAAKEVIGYFSSVTLWEGQSMAFERLAWIKIKGLPVQLLHRSVIDSVAEKIGKIVHRPPRKEEDADLSYEYMGVLVGEGSRIADDVTVNWRSRKFKVYVTPQPMAETSGCHVVMIVQ